MINKHLEICGSVLLFYIFSYEYERPKSNSQEVFRGWNVIVFNNDGFHMICLYGFKVHLG